MMHRSRRRRPFPLGLQILMALMAIGILMVMGWANYRFAQLVPGGNDFLARWTGARAWVVEGRSPYDPEVSLNAQRMIYGRPAKLEAGEDLAHFVYPLPAMVFFAPFGLLPYPLARAAWMTLLVAASNVADRRIASLFGCLVSRCERCHRRAICHLGGRLDRRCLKGSGPES